MIKNFIKDKFDTKDNSKFLNLISKNKSLQDDTHYKKTFDLWGKGIHSKNKSKHTGNDTHIEKLIDHFGRKNFEKKNFLEIGCGEGIDLKYIVNNFNFEDIYAIDIGENIEDLSKRDEFSNVKFIRCDCLDLPFEDNVFEQVYSYGVFHHTKDFNRALLEARRVIKKNGVINLYTYKKHKNLIKRYGVYFETILLKIFSNLNYNQTKFFCYLLSPIILFFFSYPAQILKLFGSKVLYKKFPLWWGTSPKNIIQDLADRLYAPINLRFDAYELKILLSSLNFSEISVDEVRDGLFCRFVK